MKVYRVYDKETQNFIKIGKRTNDIYVSKPLLITTLKRYYRIDDVMTRFDIIEYELIRTKKRED
jgi:hypothetical protein